MDRVRLSASKTVVGVKIQRTSQITKTQAVFRLYSDKTQFHNKYI